MFLEDVIMRTVAWPKRWQNPDGGFPTDNEGSSSCTWTTAGLSWALFMAGENPNEEYLKSALHWVIQNQNQDGGIPIVRKGDQSITDATAQMICALSLAVRQISDTIMDKALLSCVRWLLDRHVPGKGWRWESIDEPCYVASTSYALIALSLAKDVIGQPERTETIRIIDEATQWLARIRNDDGGWGSTEKSQSRPSHTGIVLWALKECNFQIAKPERSIEFLTDTQQEDHWPDFIDRPSGHSVNRIATPYAIVALVKYGTDFDEGVLRNAIGSLLESYEEDKGCFRFGQTDIRSWPTRDGLFALSALTTCLNWRQVMELIDYATKLEHETQTTKRDFEEFKETAQKEIRRQIGEYIESFVKRNTGLFDSFKYSLSILLLVTCILGLVFAVNNLQLSDVQIGVTFTVVFALWGIAIGFIITRKLKR